MERDLRVLLIASASFRKAVPDGWSSEAHWQWLDAVRSLPDLVVAVDAPTPESRSRLGTLEVRTAWQIADGTPRADPLLACTVHWHHPDRAQPVVIGRATAPFHPRDNGRDIRARSNELALHAIRAAVVEIGSGRAPEEVDAAHGDGFESFRPLSALERAQWRLRGVLRRSAYRLNLRMLVKSLVLLFGLVVVRPIRDRARSSRGSHPVRIFTYHRVTNLCRDSLTASRQTFAAQLRYIGRTHTVVTLDEALALLASDAPLEGPVAAITFDDAYASVYDFAAPVLAELHMPATCFAPSSYIGTDGRFPWDRDNPVLPFLGAMRWEQLQRLKAGGWTIGGHTATHARLADCDEAGLRRELEEPLAQLRQRLLAKMVPMAYPFGGPNDINESALRTVEALGYTTCLSNHGGENFPPASPFRLNRIDIGGDHDALTWKGRVHGIDAGRWQRALRRRLDSL